MRITLFLILVAALASSAFAAQKYRPYYGGSSGSKSYQASATPSKPAVSEAEKKLAEDGKLDIRKMTEKLKNGGSK